MIYCFDTYYTDDIAHTAVIGIKDWKAENPDFEFTDITTEINDYESGSFYKRELPCLLNCIKKLDLNPEEDILLIDGYVVLSDEGKLGLGGYLYHELEEKITVIGVAKNNFNSIENLKREVFRGESKKPLYVTALGMDIDEAKNRVLEMHGPNRFPTILKLVDQKSRLIS